LGNIRVVTFNIRHGRGIDGRVDLIRTAGVLAESGCRLAGLQEVDRYLPRSGFCHQPRRLGKLLGKSWAFGANQKWLSLIQYGNAVISHWPLLKCRNHPLPGRGEQRGLLEAEAEIGGVKIAFFCTQLGLGREERLVQVEKILDIVSGVEGPAILAVDLNAGRGSREFSLITGILRDATAVTGEVKSYPSENPRG